MSLPAIACRASLPILCLALTLAAQRTPDVRVDHGPTGASSIKPQIAASGFDVYVTWEDTRLGLKDVFFNRSRDAGDSWMPVDTKINTTTGPFGSGDPDLAADGASVYIAYTGDGGVRFNRSLDGGATWLAADTLLAPLGSTYPAIAAAGASVWICYRQTSTPPFRSDLFVRRSLDSGSNWLPAVRVDTDAPEAGDSVDQRIAVAGGTVYVAWRDLRSGLANVYFNRSLDGGTLWLTSDVRIDTGTAPGTIESIHNVELAASGATVYVVWWDNRNATPLPLRDIFVKRSGDRGTTFPANPTRLDTDAPGNAESHYPHLAAAGSSAWVVWSEYRNGTSDVYMNRTSDNGTTWLPSDVRVDHAPAGVTSGVTQIAASTSTVYLTFNDDRRGGIDLYTNRSLDGGATWLPIDVRLQAVSGGVPWSLQDIAVSGSSVYVAWVDGRSGSYDIYLNIPFGFQPYGAGKPGSGSFTPYIAGSGQVVLGNTVSVDISSGLGGAPGALLVGGPGSRIAIPIIGGTLLVSSLLSVGFTLGGALNVPGAGTFALPVSIAPVSGLIGMEVNIQPAFLDPGATFGISLGNAVAMWIG